MIHPPCLAVDAMGGDVGPECTVPATVEFLLGRPAVRIELHGDAGRLRECLQRCQRTIVGRHAGDSIIARIDVVHSTQAVGMAEKPAAALRSKRESSMWRALEAVAAGRASACVSAGNTGALMAMGMAVLGTLSGIDRPAVCATLPTRGGHTYLLDLGANVDCTAEQLHQFAVMGSRLATVVDGNPAPSVALLNLAEENARGNREVRAAADLLGADDGLNYRGFVEGDGVFSGRYDVIVCDGFVGNVALKTGEGVAMLVLEAIDRMFERGWRYRLAYLLLRPRLHALAHQIDPAGHNGAVLLGLRAAVVKSHGRADREGFRNGLAVALRAAELSVPAILGGPADAFRRGDMSPGGGDG